jgi:putative FmdB family regulatory protein
VPTYQYACTECGHQLEAVQSFSDAPLTICTECQGKLRKVYSSVGVVFKGSGFYRTDSRAAAHEPSKNGDTPSPKSGEKTSAGAAKPSNGTPAANGRSSSSGSSSSSSSKPAAAPA